MNPLGGHIGSEGDGLGPKQPELFDIHVMIFCGDPQSTVEGLARFFAIDRDAAERLVEDVPIVVKRAAEPDVAAEMVDVLGGLGAQVVLLPAASAVPSETDLLELKAPSAPPPPIKQEAPEWGALEPVRQPTQARAARAATVDLLAAAPMAELEIEATPSNATSLEARAPARSAPPSKEAPAIDDELVIAPLYEPGEVRDRARTYARGKEGVSLPPAPTVDPRRLPALGTSSVPPALGTSSLPPALGEAVSDLPPAEASVASVPGLPDLGLGSVPPLPTLGAGPPPVPDAGLRGPAPRVPPPAPRAPGRGTTGRGKALPPPAPGVVPAATQQRALYERTLDAEHSAQLPSLGVVAPATDARAAAARPASGGGDSYWSGRRQAAAAAGPELGELEPEAPRVKAEPESEAGGAPGEALRGAGARPVSGKMAARDDAPPVRVRSLGRTVMQVAIGLAIFGYFMQQQSSILLGNADVLSIVMHGFALFLIGAGLAELRG